MRSSLLSVVAAAILVAAACSSPRPRTEHVLIIGVDGLSSWCLEKALDSIPEQIPNISGIWEYSARTLEKRSVGPTASAINWASIFMGVPTEMHGYVAWNSPEPYFKPYRQGPNGMPETIFTLLRAQRPKAVSAAIYDWDGIGCVIDTSAITRYTFVPAPHPVDEYAEKEGVPVIKELKPELMLFYFDSVDAAGHTYGWGSPEYYDSIVQVDKAIGKLFDALAEAGIDSKTTVILISDHGGKPDRGHGTYDIRDVMAPLAIDGAPVRKGYDIQGPVMQYDVTAMIASLLGLQIPADWRGIPHEDIYK